MLNTLTRLRIRREEQYDSLLVYTSGALSIIHCTTTIAWFFLPARRIHIAFPTKWLGCMTNSALSTRAPLRYAPPAVINRRHSPEHNDEGCKRSGKQRNMISSTFRFHNAGGDSDAHVARIQEISTGEIHLRDTALLCQPLLRSASITCATQYAPTKHTPTIRQSMCQMIRQTLLVKHPEQRSRPTCHG